MASTADRHTTLSGASGVRMPQETASNVYRNCFVLTNDGNVLNATDTAGRFFAGVSERTQENLGAAGAVSVPVRREGILEFNQDGSLGAAAVGQMVYLIDNDTVGAWTATTNYIAAGRLVERISAALVRIDIEPAIGLRPVYEDYMVQCAGAVGDTAKIQAIDVFPENRVIEAGYLAALVAVGGAYIHSATLYNSILAGSVPTSLTWSLSTSLLESSRTALNHRIPAGRTFRVQFVDSDAAGATENPRLLLRMRKILQ